MSRGVVMSMRRQVLSFLFFSTMSGVLAGMVLSVWMEMSHKNSDAVILVHAHTIVSSPQCQTLCRSSSACVKLPCCGGGCI